MDTVNNGGFFAGIAETYEITSYQPGGRQWTAAVCKTQKIQNWKPPRPIDCFKQLLADRDISSLRIDCAETCPGCSRH